MKDMWFKTLAAAAANMRGELEDALERGENNDEALYWLSVSELLPVATVFDCRQLPYGLVLDTGEAWADEPLSVRGPVKLPFPVCYFEFGPIVVLAQTAHVDDAEREDAPEPGRFLAEPIVFLGVGVAAADKHTPELYVGSFDNDLNDGPNIYMHHMFGTEEGAVASAGMLTGVLELLKQRLLDTTVMPNPKPYLSAVRARKGKPPIAAEVRVLTLNVPAVRRRVAEASKPTGLKHESPCLHWRRGHWRVLHRGSEFEKNAWVNKCLVGDPDKGFVATTYRLTHRLPMLANDNPPPPPEPLGAA